MLKTTFMRKIYLMLFALACAATSWGQTIIALNDFDGTTTLPLTLSGGTSYTGNSSASDRPQSASFYVSSQTAYGKSNGSAKITSESITGLSSYTSKYFELRLASWSISSTGNGADAADSVTVRISINGASFSKELQIKGNDNAWWHYTTGTGIAETTYDGDNSPLIMQPAGGGERTTDGYSTLKINLPDACSEAKIQISLKNNDDKERWTIDDIKLVGTPVGSNYITTGTVSSPPFCVDATSTASGTVAYTFGGTFTGTFTAQLSDATGSFASAVNIGSGDSPINITIPANTPSGTGYKIRVINDNPSTIGSESTAFEIINGANNVTDHSASPGNAQATLSWTNPSGCYDEIMIVGKEGSAVTANPTGDGSAYTPNLAFGSGTGFDGGYVVYKGTTSPQTVTYLTNGTVYYFTFFTRKGTNWSSGVTANATPAVQPSLVEIYLPQYIQGFNGTNNSRVPFAFRVKLENLTPDATYRYYNQVVISTDEPTANGAGNVIFVTQTGDFYRSTNPSMSNSVNYGEFTTDENGSYTGWFITEPTGNNRFTPGNEIFMRIMLNDGAGGTSVALRLTTTNSVKVLNFGITSTNNECTGIYGNSYASDKNFVLLYDNTGGTGRPISGTFIENDGTDNTTSYVAFYSNNVNGQSGYWGSIIPNVNNNGIKKLEYRSLADGSLIYSVTDYDGSWNEVQTVNPTGGSTALILPHNNVDGLSIPEGGQLTVNDSLTIHQLLAIYNNALLTLSNNASLITEGSIGSEGQVKVIRELVGQNQFHFLSSPISGAIIGQVFPESQYNNIWLRSYNEPTGTWVNHYVSESMEVGKGYSFYMDIASSTATFTGDLNNENVNPSLTNSGSSGNVNYDGWNLLGNPYPCAIAWGQGTWNLSNVDSSVYVWNGASGNYVSYAGGTGSLTDGIIPSAQGFFVKATGSSPSLTIPIDARVHSSQSFYKNGIANLLRLDIVNNVNAYTDATFIRFDENATSGYDDGMDAYKLDGDETAPMIYTVSGDSRLSINTLKNASQNPELILYFKAGVNGEYKLTASNVGSFNQTEIYLEDLFTNARQKLGENSEYTFIAKPEDPLNRFKLVFGSVGINHTEEEVPGVYAYEGMIYIHFTEMTKAKVTINNLAGQIISRQDIRGEGLLNMPAPKASGIYLINILTNKGSYTSKVFVK
jgi:hypothetical protein